MPGGEVTVAGITLSNCLITDADLARLVTLRKPTELYLTDCHAITDEGLKSVAALTSLEILNLVQCKGIAPKGYASLASLKNLHLLQLPAFGATDADLQPLLGLSRIESLGLTNSAVTAAGLAKVRTAFPKLSTLQLSGTSLDDAAVAELTLMSGLDRLDVHATGITHAQLEELAKLPNLSRLFCTIEKDSEAGLRAVARMSRLKELQLQMPRLTAGELALLEGLKLEQLAIHSGRCDDSCVPVLAHFKSLKQLQVRDTGVSPEGVKKLAAALPGCRILHSGGVIEPRK